MARHLSESQEGLLFVLEWAQTVLITFLGRFTFDSLFMMSFLYTCVCTDTDTPAAAGQPYRHLMKLTPFHHNQPVKLLRCPKPSVLVVAEFTSSFS